MVIQLSVKKMTPPSINESENSSGYRLGTVSGKTICHWQFKTGSSVYQLDNVAEAHKPIEHEQLIPLSSKRTLPRPEPLEPNQQEHHDRDTRNSVWILCSTNDGLGQLNANCATLIYIIKTC
jgi:hypothetical protein